MCGIFGWIPTPECAASDLRPVIDTLLSLLRHRGPDDRGYAVFPAAPEAPPSGEMSRLPDSFRLLLGQTRLSILDLSPAGHQPMSTPDGRFTLVYNGEVYNYLELGEELQREGVRFCSRCDTEVVLWALIRWGRKALQRFTGMFALALYDAHENRLLCARDCFGIKPLFWRQGGLGFQFASELPALLAFPGAGATLAPLQAYRYLRFGQVASGEDTFLQDVRQLPPAHTLELDLAAPGQCRISAYWQPETQERGCRSFAAAAEELRDLFLASVRMHLRADVPLGVALSGGIDSSAVACAVRHLEPDAELHTFSFVAREAAVSEEHWAQQAAARTGAVRHMVSVEPDELLRDLDTLIAVQGEPFGSTSIYAQYRVFQLAREHGVTVTLEGQGADELLAGYYGYPGERLASLLLAGRFGGAAQFLGAVCRWPGRERGVIVRSALRELLPDKLKGVVFGLGGRNAPPAWLDSAALRERNIPLAPSDDKLQHFPGRRRVAQTLAWQLTREKIPVLLRYSDRNAMAHSVESRVPFLTRELAEFCLSLPESYLIDMEGRSKSVFREAMRGLVPTTILERRDKVGFATPERAWLECLGPWIDEQLARCGTAALLNLAAARQEWAQVREGKAPFDWRIWRWINYIRWLEIFRVGC